MRNIPNSGEFYRDYKNRLYQIVSAAEHQETGELFVIYQALYEEFKIYAGSPDLFLTEEEYEKYSGAARQYRFVKVNLKRNAADGAGNKMRHPQEGVLRQPQEEALFKPQADGFGHPQEIVSEGVDERLMEFLDTEDYETRYNILVSMRDSITDTQINNIAVVLDVVIPEGELDDRYEQLKSCLRTRQRYESCRLR